VTDDDFTPDEVRPGRRSRYRFACVPVWVLLMPELSDAGFRLYSLLLAHVNEERDDALVWPHQKSLASILKKRPEAISRAIGKELVPLGLVDVEVKRYGTNNTRRRNIYTVHEEPPAGWTGHANLKEWYKANPSNGPIKAGQPGDAIDRASGDAKDRESGDAKNRESGDAKNRAGNYTNPELDESGTTGAPAARSASDARRASAGSSACDVRGGSAAAGETSSSTKAQLTRVQAAAVSLIEDSLPEGLVEELRGKRLMGRHLPVSVRLAIVTALDGRTPEQLVDRVARRWVRHGYAEKLRDGRGIASPLGVVHALVRAGECPDLGCEDGLMLDTGVECRACEGRKDSHRRGERKTSSMPRQRQAAPSWTCSRCFTDSFTAPPETGQCPPCAAKTQADIDKLAARLQADALQVDAPDDYETDGAPWGDEEPPAPDELDQEPYADTQAPYAATFDDVTEEANR